MKKNGPIRSDQTKNAPPDPIRSDPIRGRFVAGSWTVRGRFVDDSWHELVDGSWTTRGTDSWTTRGPTRGRLVKRRNRASWRPRGPSWRTREASGAASWPLRRHVRGRPVSVPFRARGGLVSTRGRVAARLARRSPVLGAGSWPPRGRPRGGSWAGVVGFVPTRGTPTSRLVQGSSQARGRSVAQRRLSKCRLVKLVGGEAARSSAARGCFVAVS